MPLVSSGSPWKLHVRENSYENLSHALLTLKYSLSYLARVGSASVPAFKSLTTQLNGRASLQLSKKLRIGNESNYSPSSFSTKSKEPMSMDYEETSVATHADISST